MADNTTITKVQQIKIDYVFDYCEEHNEVEWLVAESSKTKTVPVYPKKKVITLNDDGTEKLDENGNPMFTLVDDTAAEPIRFEDVEVTFADVRKEFVKKFMPELLPKSTSKKVPSFHDRIKALKAKHNIQ